MYVFLAFVLILGIIYAQLMLRYSYGWKKLPLFEPANVVSGETYVTVIIPARNEAENLPALLDGLRQQTYGAALLEVILIDDFSTDDTAKVFEQFATPNMRRLQLSNYLNAEERLNSYKKKAIEIAIAESKGTLIVTSDADCVMGPKWIETLVQFYELNKPKFIAAPVSFYKELNFFKAMQSLDFMTMQGITGAAAQLRNGTLCNGANLAYEKSAFYEVGGFQGIDTIASGDDMLLMYKIFKAYPEGVQYMKSQDAIVRTLPVDTFKAFMHQRIRWSSKADKYEDKRITHVLIWVYIWNVTLLALGILAMIRSEWWPWLMIALLFKITVEMYFLVPVARFFRKTGLLIWFVPGQVFHIPYIVVAGWLGKFGSYQWKGRKVN